VIKNWSCSVKSVPVDEFSGVNSDRWVIRLWPKCGHIWPSRLWPKFGRIRKNWPWPKFSRIQSSWSRLKFCQVDLGPNLITSSPTEIRLKVIQVHPMLKFGLVGPDKKSVKFYGVSPMDTSFKKFNLNLFYEKWILNFEFWIWSKYLEYLDLDLNLI